MERNYYMVRAMFSRAEDFEIFFNNNVAAVGWSNVNFSFYSTAAALRKAVEEEYYKNAGIASQTVSKRLNEAVRFKEIKKGDYIIVPYYSYIAIAEATGADKYSLCDWYQDLANQKCVSFRHTDKGILYIPRSDLSEGLQRRLRVRGSSVANLFEFKEEIDKIFSRPSYAYSQEMQSFEQAELSKLKKRLLESLQNGTTNLQTGGIGLERLICELFQCEGYDAAVLPKNTFGDNADADIRAAKEDKFIDKKMLVQVKHHSGSDDEYGIKQIINALKGDFEDYDGYFITSASQLQEQAQKMAQKHGITVMCGDELVEWITTNLDKLSETTKRSLGICTIPRMYEIR